MFCIVSYPGHGRYGISFVGTFCSSSQEYGAGTRADLIHLRLGHKRLLARGTVILWCVATRIHRKAPGSAIRRGRQAEGDSVSAGIEHEVQGILFAFIDQAGKLLRVRISPVRQVPVRAEPMDLGIRVEMLGAQDRMGATKGNQASGEAVHLLIPVQMAPVVPAGLVVLAIGIIVTALRAAEFI